MCDFFDKCKEYGLSFKGEDDAEAVWELLRQRAAAADRSAPGRRSRPRSNRDDILRRTILMRTQATPLAKPKRQTASSRQIQKLRKHVSLSESVYHGMSTADAAKMLREADRDDEYRSQGPRTRPPPRRRRSGR